MVSIRNQSADSAVLNFLVQPSIFGVSLVFTLLTLWYAFTLGIQEAQFGTLMLGIGLALFYLMEMRANLEDYQDGAEGTYLASLWERVPASRHLNYWGLDSLICLGWLLLIVVVTVYVQLNFTDLLNRGRIFGVSDLEAAMGVAVILSVTDATRRAYGNAIGLTTAAVVVYALLGPYFPGILFHSGFTWQQVGSQAAMYIDGVYGFIIRIGVTWVSIFIIFAGMAKTYGLMDFVLDLSDEMGKALKSGVVHVAVISSLVMGSITGSAAANTATTGSFTIPMMKQQGVKKEFACAIESVASSGGQMMPPIMGVAAFLMADIVGIPYADVIQSAIIPAALFYLSVAVAVQLVVYKYDWITEPGDFDRSILRNGIPYTVPLGVLLYVLLVERFAPLSAGLYTIAALVVTLWAWNLGTSLYHEQSTSVATGSLYTSAKKTIVGFSQGAQDMAPLIGVLGALGVVVSLLGQTGLTQKISTQMVALAGGVFILLLILAMLTSILFGLGMPTPAAYLLVVILVTPALGAVGVRELTAHFFVFYFAMLSAITPPVAIAVAVGSQIADSNFLKSTWQALKIGSPGFLIPYAFVANDSVIYWEFPRTIIASVFLTAGIVTLLMAIFAYDGKKRLGLPLRFVFVVLAFAALYGPFLVQSGAFVVILAWLGLNFLTDTDTQLASHSD